MSATFSRARRGKEKILMSLAVTSFESLLLVQPVFSLVYCKIQMHPYTFDIFHYYLLLPHTITLNSKTD